MNHRAGGHSFLNIVFRQFSEFMILILIAAAIISGIFGTSENTVITVSLAIDARKMSRHHVLVRNLPAVEMLGSVTFICADKTGALTQNRMQLEQVIVDSQAYSELPA